jgi:hypothetical protein
MVYPTTVEGNHLHLTSGNLSVTSIFLGNDSQYVRTRADGAIVIGTDDTVPDDNPGTGNRWLFDATGNTTIPGNIQASSDLSITVPSGIPSNVANWQGQGGWNQGSYTNLSTTGGTGTGLTVDVVGGGGYINIDNITINNPGEGYTDGDVITIDNENNLPGTFTITVSLPVWTFKSDGSLEFPVDSGTAPKITTNTSNNYISIVNGAGDTWEFKSNGQLTIPGGVTIKSNVKTVNYTPTPSSQGSPARIWTASSTSVIGAQIICRSNVDYNSYIEICTANIVSLPDGAGNTQVMITGQVGTTSGTAVNAPYSPVSITVGVDFDGYLYAEAIAGGHDAHHVVSVTELY